EARRAGLIGLIVAVTGFAGFVLLRRRDVGFWTVSLPMQRDNEIWRLTIKADVAFRALPQNEEVYQLFKERSDFVLAHIGAKFDKLCQQIIKDSADLSTIDSTARLQMDV